MPALPKDHDLQQKRAYEIFRQHWVPSREEKSENPHGDLSTPINVQDEPIEPIEEMRTIEGRNNDPEDFYNYHLNLPLKRQLPKPPPVSPLIFDDSGCASLENNEQQKRNSPEPNYLWVGLEEPKEPKKRPKNHERLAKKKYKPKNEPKKPVKEPKKSKKDSKSKKKLAFRIYKKKL